MTARRRFSQTEIDEFREAFNLFDHDNNGSISKTELREIMNSLGHEPTDEDLSDMINEVDTNSNGELEFDEFIRIMALIMKQLRYETQLSSRSSSVFSSQEELQEAFKFVDHTLRGKIISKDIHKFADKLGQKLSQLTSEEMVQVADSNGDGSVNFREFHQVLAETVLNDKKTG